MSAPDFRPDLVHLEDVGEITVAHAVALVRARLCRLGAPWHEADMLAGDVVSDAWIGRGPDGRIAVSWPEVNRAFWRWQGALRRQREFVPIRGDRYYRGEMPLSQLKRQHDPGADVPAKRTGLDELEAEFLAADIRKYIYGNKRPARVARQMLCEPLGTRWRLVGPFRRARTLLKRIQRQLGLGRRHTPRGGES